MATEIELKLRLSANAAKQLASHPLLASIRPKKLRLLNTYYDTPALDLHNRRIALRFRKKNDQWLLTVKSAEPASGGLAVRNEWETKAAPGVFDFTHVDHRELNEFLNGSVDELHAVFSTDFQRTLWHVPFGDSLIELAVDRGSIESRGQKLPICELELELLSGNIHDIFGLTKALQESIYLCPALESKAERGYRLFTGEAAHPYHATPPEISADLDPVEAFRRIALSCLEHFQRNEAGMIETTDPEYIHQARVALRRLRSAIKLFRRALPAEFVAAYGQSWKVLAGTLGTARNWEVFLTETLPPIEAAFPGDRDILRLKNKAAQRTKQARHTVSDLIQHTDYAQLLLHFTAALYALDDVKPQDFKKWAARKLGTMEKRIRLTATQRAALTPSGFHQLRIRIKRMRYALDFFAPLFPAKSMKSRLADLALLQGALGEINDLLTAQQLMVGIFGNRHCGLAHGWVAGRHALLSEQLLERLEDWLKSPTKNPANN